MKRHLATSLSTIVLIVSLQPGGQPEAQAAPGIQGVLANLSDFVGLSSSLFGQEGHSPAAVEGAPEGGGADKAGDQILAEVSAQQFSAQAPQLDPAIQKQWAIVVFGTALNGDGTLSERGTERVSKALAVAKNNPDAVIVLAGGKPQAGVTEAQAMKKWLVENGIGADRIILEENSTNTASNARNTAALLGERGATRGVMLITAADHIRRATVNFRLASQDRYDTISIPAGNTDVVPPVPDWEKTAILQDIQQG